jgi:hypothetical protein
VREIFEDLRVLREEAIEGRLVEPQKARVPRHRDGGGAGTAEEQRHLPEVVAGDEPVDAAGNRIRAPDLELAAHEDEERLPVLAGGADRLVAAIRDVDEERRQHLDLLGREAAEERDAGEELDAGGDGGDRVFGRHGDLARIRPAAALSQTRAELEV